MEQSLLEQIHQLQLGCAFHRCVKPSRAKNHWATRHLRDFFTRHIQGGAKPPKLNFRVGKVIFFSRKYVADVMKKKIYPKPLSVYDLTERWMPDTRLLPADMHTERMYGINVLHDVEGPYFNPRMTNLLRETRPGQNFVKISQSTLGVPVPFFRPDFQLAKNSPAYQALYASKSNMEKHHNRFDIVVDVLSANLDFKMKYDHIVASVGVEAILLDDVSVGPGLHGGAIQFQQWLGGHEDDYLDMPAQGRIGVISSIGRLNEIAEQDRMDEMFWHRTRQEKLANSCMLSIILELYAGKLNRIDTDTSESEKDEDDDDAPIVAGGFATPPQKASLQPRTPSLKTPYKNTRGETQSFRLPGQSNEEIKLTYQSLCQFLRIEFKPQGGMETTVRQILPFFIHFKLGLKLYDVQHRLVFQLPTDELADHPEYDYNITKKLTPAICKVLIAHRHLFLIQDIDLEYVETSQVAKTHPNSGTHRASSKFKFPEKKAKSDDKRLAQAPDEGHEQYIRKNELHFVNDAESIIRKVIEVSQERDDAKKAFKSLKGYANKHSGARQKGKKKTIPKEELELFTITLRFIVQDCYDTLICLVASGICPSIVYDSSSGKNISGMFFSYHSVRCQVSDGGLKGNIMPISSENFAVYEMEHAKFKNSLIRKEFLSRYNDKAYAWERLFPIGPITKSFVPNRETDRFSCVDLSKAYTSCLKEMVYFPVFNEFDIWEPYNDHELEDYTQYFVVVPLEAIDGIFFTEKRCRVYGMHLKQLPRHAFPYIAVKSFKRPSHLAFSGVQSAIASLWQEEIDTDEHIDEKLKKFIVNQTIGAMGRVKNHATTSQVFIDYAEALFYQTRYGGQILVKQQSRSTTFAVQTEDDEDDEDELYGDEVNAMKRHNLFVQGGKGCTGLLDYINLNEKNIYQIHFNAHTLPEMISYFQELVFSPVFDNSGNVVDVKSLFCVGTFKIHMLLEKSKWFETTIREYIAAKAAGKFQHFIQTDPEITPSLDIFEKLFTREKFNDIKANFIAPIQEVPVRCPLSNELITEPWRNKYGRVFQKSQQLIDYITEHQQCPIDGKPLTDFHSDFVIVDKSDIPKRIYIWYQEDTADLTQGFVPIKEFIFLSCRLKLSLLRETIENRFGDAVVGCITDSLLLDTKLLKLPNSDPKKKPKPATMEDVREFLISKNYIFGNRVGNLRIEHSKCLPKFEAAFLRQVSKLDPPHFTQDAFQEYADEFNIDASTVLPNTQILGLYAGVGKTSLTIKLFPGRPHIYATPFNRLSQELKLKAKDNPDIQGCFTVHRLIGKNINDTVVCKKKKEDSALRFDEGTVIVFDEIYLNSVKMLADIWQYMLSNPHLIFLATGDVKQLPPIEQSLNNIAGNDDNPETIEAYYQRAIAQMFPNSVLLKTIKRITDVSQQNRIHRLYHSLFIDTSQTIVEVLKSVFPQEAFVKQKDISKRCICYFSKRSFRNSVKEINDNQQLRLVEERKAQGKQVVDIVRYRKQKDSGYERHFYVWDGMILVCRGSFACDNGKCFTNFQYIVHHIDGKYVHFFDSAELNGAEEPVLFKIERTIIHKHFDYNFAGTCHSYQGLSLEPLPDNQKTTILHANHAFVSRKWIYVAITRARNLDDLQFVLLNEQEIKDSEKRRQYQYFQQKVCRYREQDRVMGRLHEGEYVDASWFQEIMEKKTQCKCGQPFYITTKDNGMMTTNLTANRLDNAFPHLVINIQAMCLDCNRALRDLPNRKVRPFITQLF
jgi:hypothetical protein